MECSSFSSRAMSSSASSSPARYSSERAGTLQQRLQRGLQDRHRRLQFMGGVGEKLALLGERAMQAVEHRRHGLGQRRQFERVAGLFRRIQFPIGSRDRAALVASSASGRKLRRKPQTARRNRQKQQQPRQPPAM